MSHATDPLLDLEADIIALCLHHPSNPLVPIEERPDPHVRAYHERLSLLVRTCKTFANRYYLEARALRLRVWCFPMRHLLVPRDGGVREAAVFATAEEAFASDRLDITLRCGPRDRSTHTKMRRARPAIDRACHEETIHLFDFRPEIAGDAHAVAKAYADEPGDDSIQVGALPRMLGRLPAPVEGTEAKATFTNRAIERADDARARFSRGLKLREVAALSGGTHPYRQCVESLNVNVDQHFKLRMDIPGGCLFVTGRLAVASSCVDIGTCSMTMDFNRWLAEASSRPNIVLHVPAVDVFWERVSVFPHAKCCPTVFLGVSRQRRPRAPRVATLAAQGRRAESDSDSDE